MIETLYPIFQHWSTTGSVYIISDTHFNDPDRKTMKYDITNQEQLDIIKKYVHKQDTLIHLGDVGDLDFISQIKCYKVLIMGNHDGSENKYMQKNTIIDLENISDKEILKMKAKGEIDSVTYEFHSPFVRGYKSNNLFNEIYTGPIWIAKKLVLSHEPLNITLDANNKPIAFNIHGHAHNKNINDDYHLNLCPNIYGYIPLNLKKFIKEGFLKNINSIHREAINYQIERKKDYLYE